MKKIIAFLGILFLSTSLVFIAKQEVAKSEEPDLVETEIQERKREREGLLEEVNKRLVEQRREIEKKKLEADKDYLTYDAISKMSAQELKEHGITIRRRSASVEELIEMGLDPELAEKYRGSHFQINIIERE